MSQRSYTNDRYRKDAKVGSTRKSAAKAKPVRKIGSVETSAKKKPAEKRGVKVADGVEKDWAGLPTSPAIRKWRRVWWALLLSGLALIGISYAVPSLRTDESAARAISVLVLALSMTAVSIDLVVIRKLRKELMGEPASGKAGGKGAKRGSGAPEGKDGGKDAS